MQASLTLSEPASSLTESLLFYLAYLYPNDEQELDRMDMQHHMLKLVNRGRLLFASPQSPEKILDVGTGSGIWPIELGKRKKRKPPPQPLQLILPDSFSSCLHHM